jgi:hypothetical protein
MAKMIAKGEERGGKIDGVFNAKVYNEKTTIRRIARGS